MHTFSLFEVSNSGKSASYKSVFVVSLTARNRDSCFPDYIKQLRYQSLYIVPDDETAHNNLRCFSVTCKCSISMKDSSSVTLWVLRGSK